MALGGAATHLHTSSMEFAFLNKNVRFVSFFRKSCYSFIMRMTLPLSISLFLGLILGRDL